MTEQVDRLLKAEDGSALRFFWGTEKNNFQSEAQDRPVYDNVLYLEIYAPGSSQSSPVHTVLRKFDKAAKLDDQKNPEMYDRYGPQIKAFLENEESNEFGGTPLEQATFLDKAMVSTLREGRIFTVEGLAALPDEKLRVLGLGGRTLRDRAKAFIEQANGGEAVAHLTQEVAGLKEQLTNLKNRAETAEAKVTELEKEKGGKPDENPPPPPPPTPEVKGGKGNKSDLI